MDGVVRLVKGGTTKHHRSVLARTIIRTGLGVQGLEFIDHSMKII